jgi:ATP-binding cassette, subfamily B, bacterial
MATSPKSLSGLAPFFKPYRVALGVAALFLLLAAGTTLAFPWVLRQLIDQGLASGAPADQLSGNFCSFLAWRRLWRSFRRGVTTP